MVSTPPLITVAVAVPTRLEVVLSKVAGPPTLKTPPELTVVLVIEVPSKAVPPLKITVPVAVPEKLWPETVSEPTNMVPPALTIVLFAIPPSNRMPPELICAPDTTPPSNSTPPLRVGFIDEAVPKMANTTSVPPLRMTSLVSVPVTDRVWPLLTVEVVMEPLETPLPKKWKSP
jgi:hypothetical protein